MQPDNESQIPQNPVVVLYEFIYEMLLSICSKVVDQTAFLKFFQRSSFDEIMPDMVNN